MPYECIDSDPLIARRVFLEVYQRVADVAPLTPSVAIGVCRWL